MRLRVLQIALVLFQLSVINVFSQDAKVSIEHRNVTVREVVMEIQSQGGIDFIYDNNFEKLDTQVSVSFQDTPILEALEIVLDQAEMEYEIIADGFIVLIPKKKQEVSKNLSISGTVCDENGEALPGASVSIKGTTTGVITDQQGVFTISVEDPGAVLVVSYVGYLSQEMAIDGRTEMVITLELDLMGLEEVVVVGYGFQMKRNLTGSVGNISNEAIENKHIIQLSHALAGEVSGVTVEANTGSPGRNAANITIRGLGTFSGAGNNPLILVDGVPSSLDNLNPNDIESISVLKDAASASIYGSRAANGVILVKTKRGQVGKLQVKYSGYVGKQVATDMPELVPSWEYAELFNEFLINSGSGAAYTDEDIAKFRSGEDPVNYPNVNHYEDLFNSGNGFQTGHNLSMTGGTDMNQYRFSAGYVRQDGLVAKNSYDRYNMLLNLTSKLSKRFEFDLSLAGDVSTIDEPSFPGRSDGAMWRVILGALRLPVTYPGRLPDGTYGWVNVQYPEAAMDSESFLEDKRQHFLGNASLKLNIIEGLSLTGRIGYNYNNSNERNYSSTMVLDQTRTVGPASLRHTKANDMELILEVLAVYEKSFQDHNVTILAGYNQDEYISEYLYGFRDVFPNDQLYQLNAGSSANMQNSGSATEWALKSYFGRLNYNFKGKYLFEANARYDGSSRFSEDNRWGFFPSFSAGWRISEEEFFKNNLSWFNDLKLRASWGSLGNQQIGNYPYQSTINLGGDYPFGISSTIFPGAYITTLANTNVSWETTTVADIGIDMSVFQGQLNLVVDYFDRTTYDILYRITTSSTLGLTPSESNAGEVSNKGWDFNAIHRNNFGSFNYSIGANFSAVKNKVVKLADVDRDVAQGLFIGEPLNSIYGYVADGLFVDQDDIDSYPSQPYTMEPGFVRFKDISGPDGVPDREVDANYDRTVLGSTFPKYMYGLTLTADYKGIDISIQFTGTGGMKRRVSQAHAYRAFQNDATPQRWMVEDRWTVENPNPDASYPKFSRALVGGPPVQTSSFWLIDASYLRLEHLQIGYSLPSSVLNRLKISNLRLYLSGSNLLTFDNFIPGWDPEATDPGKLNNRSYPVTPFTSVFSIGINASF